WRLVAVPLIAVPVHPIISRRPVPPCAIVVRVAAAVDVAGLGLAAGNVAVVALCAAICTLLGRVGLITHATGRGVRLIAHGRGGIVGLIAQSLRCRRVGIDRRLARSTTELLAGAIWSCAAALKRVSRREAWLRIRAESAAGLPA